MDITYEEYINFLNHLFIQEFVDFAYYMGQHGSTSESLTILGKNE